MYPHPRRHSSFALSPTRSEPAELVEDSEAATMQDNRGLRQNTPTQNSMSRLASARTSRGQINLINQLYGRCVPPAGSRRQREASACQDAATPRWHHALSKVKLMSVSAKHLRLHARRVDGEVNFHHECVAHSGFPNAFVNKKKELSSGHLYHNHA